MLPSCSFQFARRVALYDSFGEFIKYLTSAAAVCLVNQREARPDGNSNGGAVISLRLYELPTPLGGGTRHGSKPRLRGPAYSHDHETRENPRGVWTFRRLGSNDPSAAFDIRRLLNSAVLDCFPFDMREEALDQVWQEVNGAST